MHLCAGADTIVLKKFNAGPVLLLMEIPEMLR